MKKLILAALMAVVLFGLACWLVLAWSKPPPAPARLTLPDGTSISILAVTYGTNHIVGTKTARMIGRLPSVLRDGLQDVVGRYVVPVQTVTTPSAELLVWLDQRTNSLAATAIIGEYFSAYLGDGSNFISGENAGLSSFFPMAIIYPLHFRVFPRRDHELSLNIFSRDTKGVNHSWGSLSFVNPLNQKYPEWQPESLPATKKVGDLEVTLQALETGHDGSSSMRPGKNGKSKTTYGTNRLGGENTTVVDVELRPLANTNEIWQVAGAEFSDATGNVAHNSGMSSSGSPGKVSSYAFSPGLWPGEAAWKVKLELKRTAGFRAEELLVFKNVPLADLEHTNMIAWTTNAGGITVTLQSICRRAPLTGNSWNSTQLSTVELLVSSLPAGTQFDLVSLVCDTGKTNTSVRSSSSGNKREYSYSDIPLDAKTVDFTLAVQQSRSVEFVAKARLPEVKPEAGK